MFKLDAPNSTLEHVNHRYELDGDEYVSALDLKFMAEADDKMANYLLGGFEGDTPPNFWDESNKDIKYHGLKGAIHSLVELDDCDIKFKGSISVKGAKIKKVNFVPVFGRRINLTLTVQFRPTDDQLTKVTHLKSKCGKLTIKSKSVFEFGEDEEQEELDI